MAAVACHTALMARDFDIEVLRRNLAAIMARRNRKPTTLSLAVGKSPTLVKDLLEKTGDTKVSTLFRLARELNVAVEDLLKAGASPIPAGPELFVKGRVQAGSWVEAYEWHPDDWQSMLGRPDIKAPQSARFFLEVVGDSMDLHYPDGSFVECVELGHCPAPKPGQRVIAVRTRIDGLVEATVKELIESDGRLWLVPKSSNPSHQAIPLDVADDSIEDVRIVAVVVSSVRPE